MLLRLHVRGFKNLRDAEIRFGPMTCFVGPNGVGKSNIFDAIQFLRRLAETDIQSAAESIRSPARGGFSPADLFWAGDTSAEMAFEADMIVPTEVADDFGELARPSATLLRYQVRLRLSAAPRARLELTHEHLTHLPKGDARERIGFPHSVAFRRSVVVGKRFGKAFISTRMEHGEPVVELHGDGGSRGRPARAGTSPRTILGGTNTAHYPTVVAARREMSGWHSLHLEPSSLRSPDTYSAAESVDEHGAHIASTLHRLVVAEAESSLGASRVADAHGLAEEPRVLTRVANRLARLVPEVGHVRLDDDPVREQRTVQVRMRGSDRWLGPRALSDGTLRFLALVAMEMDPAAGRVLCMEEPENGIHPGRIRDVVYLLRDFAVDPDFAGSNDNLVRQVVINTHSPDVLRQFDAPDVLFVDGIATSQGRAALVRPVSDALNWRGESDAVPIEDLAAVIGGAPVGEPLLARQLRLEFGTAS